MAEKTVEFNATGRRKTAVARVRLVGVERLPRLEYREKRDVPGRCRALEVDPHLEIHDAGHRLSHTLDRGLHARKVLGFRVAFRFPGNSPEDDVFDHRAVPSVGRIAAVHFVILTLPHTGVHCPSTGTGRYRGRPMRPAILEAWRAGLFRREHWLPNLAAGVVVGVVAIPLAMAFAIAAGASGELIEKVAAQMVAEKVVRIDRAEEILKGLQS